MTSRRVKSPDEIARRKSAWAKVGRDVFPLWSSPSRATRPLREWKDWNNGSDDDGTTPVSARPREAPPARAAPRPGPDSPYFVAPASDKALRRLLVVLCLSPALLLAVVIVAFVQREWAALAAGVALLLTWGVLKALQIRAVAQQVSSRRAAQDPDATAPGPGSPTA